MLYSKLFSKTQKSAKKYDSINATLLIKGGFIDQTMAGVYTFLPLGLRVLNKIENIIREEMDKIGQELLMPAIVPKSLWEKTGRLETVDILMKAQAANVKSKLKNAAEYILNSTHEEVITPIAQKFKISYKDFPFAVYQIQTKFRNEERPKSGLLRCREFRMKDLYSFHTSEKDLKDYYERVKVAYLKVLERVGFGKDTVIALASGGDFTKDYSHEFQIKCETGEDLIFYAKKANIAYNQEVAPSRAPAVKEANRQKLPMKEVRGEGIIGVETLAKFLKIPVSQTTKTILFETNKGEVIAVVVRGNYEVSEYKLKKIVGFQDWQLASEETVRRITGAEVGYTGPLNLPKEVKVYFDESMKGRINFECGANRTNYYIINVNFGRDIPEPKKYYDLKIAKPGDYHPDSKEKYEIFKASEVGNTFPLNIKFTKAFDYTYVDQQGKNRPIYMGCYGLGSSRIMGVIVEKFHDKNGIIWPASVAPYKIHLLGLGKSAKVYKRACDIYSKLVKAGLEILFDDRREVAAGEKFADADLLGIPYRLVVSEKTKEMIEVKKRSCQETKLMGLTKILKLFKK